MIIAGVDEVGRGPLAGPVVTAAVILNNTIEGLCDSKKMSAIRRKTMSVQIKAQARCYSFGRAEVEEIEALNIHHATLLAMRRAIEALPVTPDKVLIDGAHIPKIYLPCFSVVKGDELIEEISAASILAKVVRDEEMNRMATFYPGYGFELHKGYGTAFHKEKLLELGPCAIHRKKYAPVAELLKLMAG